MKKDLSTIINNREHINNLENLLQNAYNKGKEENENNDINRLNYFLNNFNKSISFVNNNNLQNSNNNFNLQKNSKFD